MVRSVPLIILLVLALCVLIQNSNACGGGSGGGGGNDGDSSDRNSRPGFPFRSSQTNREIAEKNYPNSAPERFVATAIGDELPNMRDDLIDRKNKGEGFFERHGKAWANPKNWEGDPDNDRKETEDPARGK